MKIRWFLALAILSVVVLAGGCAPTGRGERIVAKDVVTAIWSKDGKGLYYYKRGNIYRYDVATHRRQPHRIQKEASEGFDLSPDESKIVFKKYGEGIYTAELKTGQVHLVHPARESVLSFNWTSASHIVFSMRVPDKDPEMYLLDASTGSQTRFKYGSYVRISASEGGGFVYLDKESRCRYHDLDDGTDKALPSCPPFGGEDDVDFIFLDDHKLMYNVWRYNTYQYTEIVDLRTLRTRRTILPDTHPEMQLSPDLHRCWRTNGPLHSDWDSYKLYLVDIPPEVVTQLKAPVK